MNKDPTGKDVENIIGDMNMDNIANMFIPKKEKKRMMESELRLKQINLRTKLILRVLIEKFEIPDKELSEMLRDEIAKENKK